MTLADVLWPSLLYLRLHPSPSFELECHDLLSDLPGFYNPATRSISNDFKRPADERADSWYPFENGLVKYPMIGSLSGSKELTDHFLAASAPRRKWLSNMTISSPFITRSHTSRGGSRHKLRHRRLVCMAAILAHKLTGDDHYLEEARRAVRVLYTVPADRLFHEPQELAYGALAAAELGMQTECKYLLYEELRMFYWFSDPSQKSHEIRGMVQARPPFSIPRSRKTSKPSSLGPAL